MLLSAQYLVGVRHADKGSSARVGWSSPSIVIIASSSPDDVLPQVLPRKRPIGGGASPGMGATLSTGGLVSTRGLASYELAVWVVLFMDTGPRATRRPIAGLSHNHADPDPRTNDRGETTFGPPTQFDHWTQYLNAAEANLEFPSRFSAGSGAITFPRDRARKICDFASDI